MNDLSFPPYPDPSPANEELPQRRSRALVGSVCLVATALLSMLYFTLPENVRFRLGLDSYESCYRDLRLGMDGYAAIKLLFPDVIVVASGASPTDYDWKCDIIGRRHKCEICLSARSGVLIWKRLRVYDIQEKVIGEEAEGEEPSDFARRATTVTKRLD